MEISADSIGLENQGTISAVTFLGQGGNIALQVRDDLILRNRSVISTRAGTENIGGGNGGNITINTGVLAVVENSNINANAFKGAGGNIRITTKGVFLSPDSSITASSTLGVNGLVEINQLGVDPSKGLVELPENFTDPKDRIATDCAASKGNSFAITGRGGLPEDPTQALRGRNVWQDLRLTNSSNGNLGQGRIPPTRALAQNQQPKPLVEATGWVINANGQVELLADVPNATSHTSWQRPADCPTLTSSPGVEPR